MGQSLERRVAAACDSALDFTVLAFAAWTLIYTACLPLGVPVVWAAVAAAIALVPCARFVRRHPPAPSPSSAPVRGKLPSRLHTASIVAGLAAATIGAVVWPWPLVWSLWLVATITALAWWSAPGLARGRVVRSGAGARAAIAWAAGLGAMSLLVVDPDMDDAQYVHTSTWVAARGRFPIRDILFSDERMEALFFPPWSSIEGLAGTAARLTGLSAPAVVYLLVTPIATALSVLALWRLLRAWRVPAPALALSTALIFLLASGAGEQRTVGHFFVGRIWQGKAMFVALLVPLVFVLLDAYVRRPTRHALVLLGAAGVAAVGLTSTSLLVIPVIALGALAPFARGRPRAALGGLAALAGYPLLAATAGLAIGMRNPDLSQGGNEAGALAQSALGIRVPVFVTLAAILVGPTLLPRAAGRSIAGVALVVALLLAPGVPAALDAVTGVGESLWRVAWAVPIAALVGAGATSVRGGALPALAASAAMVAWAVHAGLPPSTSLSATPALKRSNADLRDARAILDHAQPGDRILAPQQASITLLVLSAGVTTVDPRDFYTFAAGRTASVHARTRVDLQALADPRLAARRKHAARYRDPVFVARALRVLGIDVACVKRGRPAAVRVLRYSGYSRRFTTPRLACLRR